MLTQVQSLGNDSDAVLMTRLDLKTVSRIFRMDHK
jgi:hypothetical protein